MQRAAVLHVQPVVVVQVQRAGDVEPALQDLVAGALGQRGRSAEGGGARAVHGACGPQHAAADVDVAAAGEVGAPENQIAAAGDGRIAQQREAAVVQRERTVTRQFESGRKLVSDPAVRRQLQRTSGGDVDARSRVSAEARDACAAGIEMDVAIMGAGAKNAGRRDMHCAAVLDEQGVVVVQVKRAGNVEPALQDLVRVVLRQFPCTGQRDRTVTRDGAAVPDQTAQRQRGTAVQRAGQVQGA